MKDEHRRVLSRNYFSRDRLAEHHFRSFNAFLDRGMQEVVDEKGRIDTDIGDKEGEEPVWVELGEVRVVTPRVREADGSEELLYPQEARLRNITYAAPVFMEMAIVKGDPLEGEDRIVDQQEVKIGRMPIMVGSTKCNIDNFSEEELIRIGEDPADPGGYFIVNGSERVLMTSEDLAPNKILCEYDTKYGDQIEIAKTFSQRRGYRALVLCERTRDGLLEVSFPSVSGSINFVTLVRALGLESDEEIVHRVSEDPEIVKYMLENLEAAEVQTTEEAIETLGRRVASGQGKNYQLKRANYVIDRYLLPHLHEEGLEDEDVRINKAIYLCRMAEACFELALERRDPDDKDHYANKRLKVSGDLMRDLFRTALNKLSRDVKYQLERAHMRNRKLQVTTVVRSDVLTERLEHPIATGNWVGGRSGVSQLVDRTDYMGVLSHLRRLRSPLSRSQPHFEARDLHATQWGRICPSETPEGPNCGLVKNFAQSMELSQHIADEQELKRELAKLGVQGIQKPSDRQRVEAD
ncbi:MAG: DNA-directed RNA polymerase subunit B'' [Halobacteriales archaeon]